MRTLFIIRRIIVQTINDKRSLGLILIVPLFLFTLIYFLLGESMYQPEIAQNGMPQQLIEQIEVQNVSVKTLTVAEGKLEVKDNKIDGFLYTSSNKIILLMETNDSVKSGIIIKAIQNAFNEMNPASVMQVDYLYGESDATMFQSMGYVLLGVISFFLIFILAGISFVRERTNQTMERLMITPVKRWQVVLGYTLGFGIFAMLQSIFLLCYVTWVLKMTISGSMIATGFVMILLSMSAVCIGAFCSIFANNEFQIMQFIPVVVIPQIFFSGLISLDTIPYNLGIISRIMPVYYACNALEAIITKGAGFKDIIWEVTALLLFIILFFFMNIIALKKYRRI